MHQSEPRQMLATIAEQFARTARETGLTTPGPGVLEAMSRIPRERFVPAASAGRAYDDAALSLACGQTISQPFIVALMTSLLQTQTQHRVLEIGAGSGYQAAVLGELVRDVQTIELVPELAAAAIEHLQALGYDNVHVHTGDGERGWPEHAPYDGILVACGSESVPPALLAQLAPHGHLVMPLGPRDHQRLVDITRDGEGIARTRDVLGVRFVPFVRTVEARHERFETARGIGLRASAATEAQAFAELALALSSLVVAAPEVQPQRRVEFACSVVSGSQLLSRWLEEVLWAMRRERLVFRTFDVRLRGDSLRASGLGEPVQPRHRPLADPKRLLLRDAKAAATAAGWSADCVVATAT